MIRQFGFLLFVAVLSGCTYVNQKKSPESQDPGATQLGFSPGFVNIKSIVLDAQCNRCHSTAGGNQGSLNLETYQNTKAALNKIYFRSVQKQDMPPGAAMPASSVELLKNWIDSGAPENPGIGKTSKPIPDPVDWLKVRDLVLKNNCFDCHSGENAIKGIDFSKRDVVIKEIKSILDSAVYSSAMPIEPYPGLSSQEKLALLKWVTNGMPE